MNRKKQLLVRAERRGAKPEKQWYSLISPLFSLAVLHLLARTTEHSCLIGSNSCFIFSSVLSLSSFFFLCLTFVIPNFLFFVIFINVRPIINSFLIFIIVKIVKFGPLLALEEHSILRKDRDMDNIQINWERKVIIIRAVYGLLVLILVLVSPCCYIDIHNVLLMFLRDFSF